MLNTYNHVTKPMQRVKINAVNGLILKNHPKSFFRRFHLNSQLAKDLLCDKPVHSKKGNYKEFPVIVLQMMVCGDMEVIAEIVFECDYNLEELENE